MLYFLYAIRPESRDANPEGDVWMEFQYYENDTVYRHESSAGEVTTFSYNYFRRQTVVTHPNGATEVLEYDWSGNLKRHETARGVVRSYEHEGGGQEQTKEIDGLGFETTASYDDDGNILSRQNRVGDTETWTQYNAFGQAGSHVDLNGNEQRLAYDSRGNLKAELAEVDGSFEVLREHDYDVFGNRIETREYTEEGGGAPRTTRFEYDPSGTNLIRIVDALGNSVRIGHDALGRPIEVETQRGTTVGSLAALSPPSLARLRPRSVYGRARGLPARSIELADAPSPNGA
ncbi:MAG: RHS repeat protein, partial [bacterium]|nr:RHS repeat protein [bacterium]